MPHTTPHHTGKSQSGIAMLGIVLVIVIILIAMIGAISIGPKLQNIGNERKTSKSANVIVDAMRQYYLARGELPDPSSVPVGDLNLEQRYRFDAWGQEWEYHKAPTITGMTVDGQQVAGVLISYGPNQVREYDSSCGSDYCQQGNDIVIPINVQAEAIQKTNDALTVLANRTESSGICPSDYTTFEDFLTQLGLGTYTYEDDPWNVPITWGGGTLSSFISNGSPSGEIRSRRINCVSSPPPGTPLAHLDFSVGFTVGMTPEEIADAHPDIAEVGNDVSIVEVNGETVLSLIRDSDSWVRLNDLISNPIDFCEYTIMGWFRTGMSTEFLGPIINRETSWTNRNFWVTLWVKDEMPYSGSPIVQRASSSGNQYAFDKLGVGEGEDLFRDLEWNFFAVNMEASNSSVEVDSGTCKTSNGLGSNFTCKLFASNSACAESESSYVDGPDVGENINDLPIYIGYSDTGADLRHFNGYIREIAIYSRRDGILAEGEIRNWYGRSAWMPQPVAEYRFEEADWDGTDGEVRDNSGYGNHGTAMGGATTTDIGDGVIGRAGRFIASNDQYINIPDHASLEMHGKDGLTVAGWIKQTLQQTGWRTILSKSNESYDLQLQNGVRPRFTIYDTTWKSVNADDDIEQNRWYHIVGTFDGSTVRMYVDGILQTNSETASGISSASGSPVYIGDNSGDTGRYFHGLLDEFKIYDQAFTPEQVCALYQKENACLEHGVCNR
jgi:hypothetical protein